jgi:alanyl-tRNA synthetase
VVALFSVTAGKVALVVATTPAARDRKLAAGALVSTVAPAFGGRGGGKPDIAQGGGTDPSGIESAVEQLRAEVHAAAGR